MYLQEHFKINLLEKEWKEIISPEAFIQKEMYTVNRVKRDGAHDQKSKRVISKEEDVFEKEKQRILQAENALNTLALNIIES